MKRSCYPTLLVVFAICISQTAFAQNIIRPYPFKMPTRDTTRSPYLPNQSDEIAGSHGALSLSSEGHIVATDNTRLRFFGTTLWNNAQFLSSADAKVLAKRLKKLGYNAVHFAFNDYYNNDDASFFKYRDSANQLNKSSYIVNPIQLAKFDTLFAELKNNGIYTIMTTLSSHRYIVGDGVMYADSTYANGYLMPFLDPAAARLEREWIRTFLSHRNPLTSKTYAGDPALAMLEYNYEASLYYYWSSLDRLIYIDQNNYGKGKNTISYNYSRRLDTLYNQYLLKKYGSDQNLKNAWGGSLIATTNNQLVDGSFENPFLLAWSLANRNSATAVVINSDGGIDSLLYVKIRINTVASNPNSNDIAYSNISARLGKDTLYNLSFWAKMGFNAAAPTKINRNINIILQQVGVPNTRSFTQTVKIDTAWTKYNYTFRCAIGGLQQLILQLGSELGDVWFDAVSVKMQPEIGLTAPEHLASSTILRLHSDGTLRSKPLQRTRDLVMFYDSIEKSFFSNVNSLVKDTLHFSGLVNHRQHSSWQQLPDIYTASSGDVMDVHNTNDFVGGRPSLPNSDSTWMVRNTSMLRSKSGSVLPIASAGAVKNKAFLFGDFQIPWANQYQAEEMMLLPAWGAYQDWDGIFFSVYATARGELFADSLINPYKVSGSFNAIANNPAIMSLAPFASRLFREGLVKKADFSDSLIHDAEDVWLYPAFVSSHGTYGVEGPLENNVFTQFKFRQSFNSSRHKLGAEYPYLADTSSKQSDTQELYWDQTNGLMKITAPLIYGAAGTFGKDTAKYPTFTFSRTDAAASKEMLALYLMSADSTPIDKTSQLLLAVSTRAQNTGLQWTDSNGFGKNFGTAPTVLSAATLSLSFTTTKDTLVLTPLDGLGNPKKPSIIGVRQPGENMIRITLDQQVTASPWYTITFKDMSVTAVSERDHLEDFSTLSLIPNPANGYTNIKVYHPGMEFVSIRVVDILGNVVAIVYNDFANEEIITTRFDTGHIANGIYTVIITTPHKTFSRRLTIIH